MLPQWLALMIIGLIVYGLSLAPPSPPTWRPFLQWIGGLLFVLGVLLLVLAVLGIYLPS